jgi:hypothetical protein
MKTNRGSGYIDPRFLDLGTSWRWVVSFMPLPLYPRGKDLRHSLDRRLGGLQSPCGQYAEVKILDPTGSQIPTSQPTSILSVTFKNTKAVSGCHPRISYTKASFENERGSSDTIWRMNTRSAPSQAVILWNLALLASLMLWCQWSQGIIFLLDVLNAITLPWKCAECVNGEQESWVQYPLVAILY